MDYLIYYFITVSWFCHEVYIDLNFAGLFSEKLELKLFLHGRRSGNARPNLLFFFTFFVCKPRQLPLAILNWPSLIECSLLLPLQVSFTLKIAKYRFIISESLFNKDRWINHVKITKAFFWQGIFLTLVGQKLLI